jgi:uridine kinase
MKSTENEKNNKRNFLVLVTGGSASGKTTLVNKTKEKLEKDYKKSVLIISIDSYYSYSPLLFQTLNPTLGEIFKWEELNNDLNSLLRGDSIFSPSYDQSSEKIFTRSENKIESSEIIIVEGIFSLFYNEILNKADLKVYVDVNDDLRLKRRLERYKKGLEEGKFTKPIDFEVERFKTVSKKNHENYIEPTKKNSDLIIGNSDNLEKNAEDFALKINNKLEKLSSHSFIISG